jgi:F-type H+-transporting ATPase subunit b
MHRSMLNKKLLASFLVALVAFFGLSSAAFAGGGEGDSDGGEEDIIEVDVVNPETGEENVVVVDKHELEEKGGEVSVCVVEAIAHETDPAECQEAPNPILPATNELIWGGLAFLILFLAMWKWGYPPIKKAMEGRTERIRQDLDEAEQAKVAAQETQQQYEQKLAEAKAESNRIIEEARKSADALRADLEKRAQADIAEMRQRAQADVEGAKAQAIADLQAEVANIVVGAAEVVVRKSLDPATQSQLVEDYINEVARS